MSRYRCKSPQGWVRVDRKSRKAMERRGHCLRCLGGGRIWGTEYPDIWDDCRKCSGTGRLGKCAT